MRGRHLCLRSLTKSRTGRKDGKRFERGDIRKFILMHRLWKTCKSGKRLARLNRNILLQSYYALDLIFPEKMNKMSIFV